MKVEEWRRPVKPELIVIKDASACDDLFKYLLDKDYVAFDTETTGLSKSDTVIGFSVCTEESKAFYVILYKWDNTTQQLIPTSAISKAKEILASLVTKKLICHNATFDCIMVKSNFGIDLMPSIHTDTMILAHLLNENRRVGLKELSSSVFGEDSADESNEMKQSVIVNGGKLTKNTYEMYKCDPYIMGKYGAKDAWLTYRLFYHLVPILFDQGLDTFFYEEESMPLLRGPTYDLNTTGIQVDINRLQILKKTLETECEEAKLFIHKEIHEKIKDKFPGTNKRNAFNIGACQQLSWLVFGQYGLEFGTLTKAGKEVCKALGLKLPYSPSAKREFIAVCTARLGQPLTPDAIVNDKLKKGKKIKEPWAYIAADKKILSKLSSKYKWIERLLEYQRKQKLLNTYVIGIEERIQYGIVTSSYLQHGTMTGRYASRNPNLMNLPRDDQRIKECFVARTGKVFVSADYSQLEPRVFSYYSGDTRLMQSFDGKTDFYSVIGQEVYRKYDCEPQKEGPNAFGTKYKSLRQNAKTIALARAYGATPNQLAPTVGKSIEETTQDLLQLDEAFPGIRKMMLDAHELVKSQGYVTNLFKRPRRLPDALKINRLYGKVDHWDLPYEARRVLNMACNFRIQSTGASIINRAAITFHNNCKKANIDCKIVSQIHDELVIECPEKDAPAVNLLLQDAMETTTMLPGITLEAIPRISKTLAK